jgi:two-component system chemotaxis response regulator CheB
VKKIRVLVVDDSPLCRDILRAILEEDGDIEVVGEAADGDEARSAAARLRPSVITLDIEMPGTDGLTAIGRIMAESPTPILVVTGRPAEQRSHTLFEAVRRGALDLFPKPSSGKPEEAKALRVLVRRMASVPVVRHLKTQSMRSPPAPVAAPLRIILPGGSAPNPAHASKGGAPLPGGRRVRVIGIGASAGGPAAVAAVLGALPKDLSAAVVVVQHMLTGFTRAFCDFLRLYTKLDVFVGDELQILRPGAVFVAPDDRHLVASPGDQLTPLDAPPSQGHRPSVDVLFHSLATVHGKGAAGVMLSGMGEDGARGLAAMAKEGALTLAQSAEGCAVYGMPRAAVLRGAVQRQLPLGEIADALVRATRGEGLP